MEAADATVSIDLLVRSLIALGAGPKEVARAMGGRGKQEAGGADAK
jgi:hypothetical protein